MVDQILPYDQLQALFVVGATGNTTVQDIKDLIASANAGYAGGGIGPVLTVGATGATGPAGSAGGVGATGSTGPIGPSGVGATGATGVGTQGATGATGPAPTLTASRALISGAAGEITTATTTATEIGYVNGVTSSIQTQLDAKQATLSAGSGIAIAANVVSFDTTSRPRLAGLGLGINGNSLVSLLIQQAAQAGGTSPSVVSASAGAHTSMAAEVTDINYFLNRTLTFSAASIATQRSIRTQAPTLAGATATAITNAVSHEISGPPVAGTNATITTSHGLRIASTNVGAGTTTGVALTVAAPTGASSNYAAVFTGGNVGIGNSAPTSTLDVTGTIVATGLTLNVGATNPIKFGQNASFSTFGAISLNNSFSDTGMVGFFGGATGDTNFYFNAPGRIILRPSGSGGNSQFVFGANSMFGIGVGSTSTNPAFPLDIAFSNASATLVQLRNNSTNGYSAIQSLDSSGGMRFSCGYANSSAAALAGLAFVNSGASTDLALSTNATERMRILASNGAVGIGVSPTNAFLHLTAGTTTLAPLKFSSGTNLTSPVNGTMEYDGTNLYFTTGGVRKTVTLI